MNGAVMFPSSVRANTTLYKLSLHMRSGGRMRVCSLSGIISTHTVPEMGAPSFLVHLLIAYQNSLLAVDGTRVNS